MTFKIIYRQKFIDEDLPFLDHAVGLRIQASLQDKLQRDPVRFGKPMRYDWAGARSLRVGDYRVVYEVDVPARIVTILTAGHRRYIYDQ